MNIYRTFVSWSKQMRKLARRSWHSLLNEAMLPAGIQGVYPMARGKLACARGGGGGGRGSPPKEGGGLAMGLL